MQYQIIYFIKNILICKDIFWEGNSNNSQLNQASGLVYIRLEECIAYLFQHNKQKKPNDHFLLFLYKDKQKMRRKDRIPKRGYRFRMLKRKQLFLQFLLVQKLLQHYFNKKYLVNIFPQLKYQHYISIYNHLHNIFVYMFMVGYNMTMLEIYILCDFS